MSMLSEFAPLAVLLLTPTLAAAQVGPPTSGPAEQDARLLLPPALPDAGGDNVPNVGMLALKKLVSSTFQDKLISSPVSLPPGTVVPQTPAPLGWAVTEVNLYLPDYIDPVDGSQELQDELFEKLELIEDHQFPEAFWFSNSDPSGSLDETALDAEGQPVHFNLHWPQAPAEPFWLEDQGLDPNSPLDDLRAIQFEIERNGDLSRVPEAIDILMGTNATGALDNRAYLGFPLIRAFGAIDNTSFDPETRNIEITQLWYENEILSNAQLLEVPADGEYTITWKLRGLGDVGPDRSRAFPIDEFSAMPMKKASNVDFWRANSWIWKWFDSIELGDGRRFALQTLYDLHTGSEGAPSYSELNPGDPRYWLHADRSFDMGSYVGEGDLENFLGFHGIDLDLDGQIGGYLVDGTSTGAPHDEFSNAEAQFNAYGKSETAVPRINWAEGPAHVPYFGYDSSFQTVERGKGMDLTVRYGQGEMQAGLYIWGWRVHPPRIHWIETYSPGQILASGAPKRWRFKHKWDEVAELGLGAIGDYAPEKRLLLALRDLLQGAGTPEEVEAYAAATDGILGHVADRRGLPPTPGLTNFPEPTSDINFLFTNLDIYGDRETISAPGKLNWAEGDVITVTVHNDDNVERYFRVVDFGTTDYQYNGLDMGRLDWKPVYGFPQFAARAWSPTLLVNYGFGPQGAPTSFWSNTPLAGQGHPFYVDPAEEDLATFWPAGERDLIHVFDDLSGFSGPGFTSETSGGFGVWGNQGLAGKQTSSPDLWRYSYGRPIPANTTVTFQVEMPRAAALNNGAMYMFDPQFHSSSIFTMHPTSEVRPEGLDD